MVSFHIKNIRLLITLLLIAGLFFAVYLSQKRQDIRQRATAPVYTFNNTSTITTQGPNWYYLARKKSDGSYIELDNTWWTGNKYAYDDWDGDPSHPHLGGYVSGGQISPTPVPPTPTTTRYNLPEQFSNSTQGEQGWDYHYLGAASFSTSELTFGNGQSSQWFSQGWTVAGGQSWMFVNKHTESGRPDKLRIIPGDNQKVYIYWKPPGPGQATINVASTKTNDQGGGYKLGIAYAPNININRIVLNQTSLQGPLTVWGQEFDEKSLSGSRQMTGNDALVFYVDPDNSFDSYAFGDVSDNIITVQFTPPPTAPTPQPTPPPIDGMDRNFKIEPGMIAPSRGSNSGPNQGYDAVVRWVAPSSQAAGTINITGSFTRCCTQTTNPSIYSIYKVRKNDEDLWTGQASDTSEQPIQDSSGGTLSRRVSSGDKIEFWVDNANDDSGWDASYLNATISYVEPTATPAPTEIPTPTTSVTDTPIPTETPIPPTATTAPTEVPTATLAPTATPTPAATATPPPPTASPAPTTIPPPPTLTPAPTQPVPTATLAPTATPVPGGVTIAVTLNLQGIGPGGNSNPTHPQRPLTLTLIDANETVVKEETGTIAYNNQTGVFSGTVDLGQVAPTAYTVKVKTPRYLRKTAATIFTITTGAHTIQGTLTLVAGDISGDNQLDIADYNIFVSCFGAKANTLACGANKDLADLTDDGKVDLLDYRIFFENLLSRRGD